LAQLHSADADSHTGHEALVTARRITSTASTEIGSRMRLEPFLSVP